MPKDSRSTNESNEVEIAVVGGGIAGLYCCYQLLKKEKRSIRLYEASNRLGGRIETWSLEIKPGHGDVTPVVKDIYYPKDLLENPPEFFRAEFGPMRIEPKHQPFLKDLLKELGIAGDSKSYDALIPFSSYKAEEPTNPKFTLTGEEAEQHSLLDLLLLAIRRIFEMIEWPKGQDLEKIWNSKAMKHWKRFTGSNSVHRRYWKAELQEWICNLDEDDYEQIRKKGAHIDGFELYDMGFWNILSDVLDHFAVLKLRDWASFYHLLSENPNAAEWIIFWLRAIKSSGSLQSVQGGMVRIIFQLDREIKELWKELCKNKPPQFLPGDDKEEIKKTPVHVDRKLTALEPCGDRITLTFNSDTPHPITVSAKHVILALPKSPLEKLDLPRILRREIHDPTRADQLQKNLNAVTGFPLLKCFFILDNPWWEDDRPLNRLAADLPTRELQYFKSKDKSKGMIMVYTDRPATQFWADYLPRTITEQTEAMTWCMTEGKKWEDCDGERLCKRFVQYAREYEHNDFSADRLLAIGIRDWGREPYGAAAHAWRPGVKSWEVIEQLKAFSLTQNPKAMNIHICGEAYSDHQGFIEGALRSADKVISVLK